MKGGEKVTGIACAPQQEAKPSPYTAESLLYLLMVVLAASLIWLTPWPPMVDFPQHVAQISALKDFISGVSLWQNQLSLNLLTPYYAAYFPSFLLSYIMTPLVAFKVVMTLSFLAFISACLFLMKEMSANLKIGKWLILPSFFGFAWGYGFVNFLAAVPYGLLYIIYARRYAHTDEPPAKQAALLVLYVGGLLLSHGLILFFSVFIAGLVVLERTRFNLLRGLTYVTPYIILVGLMFLYVGLSSLFAPHSGDHAIVMGSWLSRLLSMPYFIVSNQLNALSGIIGLLMLFPVGLMILSSKHQKRSISPERLVPLLGIGIVWFALPHIGWGTAYLFQRFGVFMLPFFALVIPSVQQTGQSKMSTSLRHSAQAIAIATSICFFCFQGERALSYAQESLDTRAVIDALPPSKSVLRLYHENEGYSILDGDLLHQHDLVWYQVEKQGWVLPNFASFHPEVIHYTPNAILQQYSGRLEFDAIEDRASSNAAFPFHLFDYIIIRETGETIPPSIEQNLCPHRQIGLWRIFTPPPCQK